MDRTRVSGYNIGTMASEFEGLKTEAIAGKEPTIRLASTEIVVVDGPDAGAKMRLTQGTTRLGTSPTSHFRLHDPTVSRLHCELQLRGEGVRLVDAGSTNGTFIDGVRVRDADLAPGATVRVGATSLRLRMRNEPLNLPLSTRDRFGGLLGASVAMRRIYSVLERAAPSDATSLVTGETGTGKEMVARAIHDASPRARGPFVALDCGALAPSLIESELFGHVRGSFTGALSDRKGVFEEADGGTLFFDEIGELPTSLQPKLLRVLETREVRRLGSNVPRKVDVRVVAATNRTLAEAVNRGTFREDLYYRLAVVEIELPPLRARPEDIAVLARHFYERFAGPGRLVPPELISAAASREWPGNVRELRNFMERCASLGWEPGNEPELDDADLPEVDVATPFKEARRAWTRAYVQGALAVAQGNVTRAAEHAGVSRRFFQRLMSRIERPAVDDDDDE